MKFWKKLCCFVEGHQLRPIQCLTERTTKVYCHRCERYFALDKMLNVLVPWDDCAERVFTQITRIERTNK